MPTVNFNESELQELVRSSTQILVLAGAGFSVELGTPAYWTGPHRQYGEEMSKYGLTALEHATARFWTTHPTEQMLYAMETFRNFNAQHANVENTSYQKLLQALQGKEYFVATTNVDNAFYDLGFNSERLWEMHGSTRNSQCVTHPQAHKIFPTVQNTLMFCTQCSSVARPNVLYFDDYWFNEVEEKKGYEAFHVFKRNLNSDKALVLEIGVGEVITPLRQITSSLHGLRYIPVIRVNPAADTLPVQVFKPKSLAPFFHVKSTLKSAGHWLF